jgi:hypothetical protein
MQLWSTRRLLLAAFSLLSLAAVLRAGDPPAAADKDTLDEARRRDAVAEQKTEADFRAALLEMSKLEGSNPARAAERLKRMLTVLEDDTTLSPAKRAAWKRVLKDRIRVTEVVVERAAKGEEEAAVRETKKDDRLAKEEEKKRKDDDMRNEFKQFKELHNAGRDEEAQRKANDIATKYPNSPAAAASRYITGIAGAKRENDRIKAEGDSRRLVVTRQVEISGMPPIDDIEFPSPEKWRDITKRRTKSVATEKEKAILKALDTPITIQFEGSTLESVIDYLQTLSGVTIILDKKTLDDVGASYDTPVTIRKMKVTLRTALRKVLGEVPGNLTYIVEKETIHILNGEEAKKKMTVRTYYLGDLAGMDDPILGPLLSRVKMAQNIASLIHTITDTVEPDSWKVNNPEANGSITFDPVTLNLVVRQSAEVHYMLGGFGR